jgi:hypothetical protein
MIRTVVLIPIRDNEGRRFPASARKQLERQLLQFGGFTRVPGIVGVWQSGDQIYRDRHHQYVVTLTTWSQLPSWLDVVRWACATFRQEAMYVEVAGVPDIIASQPGPSNLPEANRT